MIAQHRVDSDFTYDYHVSFTPDDVAKKEAFYNYAMQDPGETDREGTSVFYKDPAGQVFHTYSTYARGIDMLNVDCQCLDLVPKGRDEDGPGPVLGAPARRIRPVIRAAARPA